MDKFGSLLPVIAPQADKLEFHIFIFIIFQFQPLTSASLENSNLETSSETISFTTDLIKRQFTHCTLVFQRDNDNEENSDKLNHIAKSTDSVYLNMNYLNSSLKSEELFQNKTRVVLENNLSLKTSRRSDRCKVVVIMASNANHRPFFYQISNTLAPVFAPFVQKDVDHFIFITQWNLIDSLLLNEALPAKLKYKIALAEDTQLSQTSAVAGDAGNFVIRSVCFFCDEGFPRIVEYAPTDPTTFDYFPDYVQNLNGKVLRVTCPAIRSRIETSRPWNANAISNLERGIWKNLIHDYLMVKFNYTYNSFLSTGVDGNFGAGGTGLELPNGTWIGTIGDIMEDKADIALCTAPSPSRMRHVTFTNSFFDVTYLTFITPHPKPLFSSKALLWPFDLTMWLCIILSTLIAFVAFGIISKAILYFGIEVPMSRTEEEKANPEKSWGFRYQILFVTSTYLDQDCVMPTSLSLRSFATCWLFFTLVITTVYRSKMVSLLATPILEEIPTTFEELAKSNFKLGFMKQGDAAYNTLVGSKDPVYVKLVKEMEVITGVGLECLKRVITLDKYACIAYNVSVNYLSARNFSSHNSRKLAFAPDSTYTFYMGMVLAGGSIYRQGFDKWLAWTRAFNLPSIWESNDLQYNVRLKAKEWLKTNQVEDDDSNLTLKHVSGSFRIIVGGLLIGFISFVLENIIFYRKKIYDEWLSRLFVILCNNQI